MGDIPLLLIMEGQWHNQNRGTMGWFFFFFFCVYSNILFLFLYKSIATVFDGYII